MKILVTGGAGYIGSICVLTLAKRGHEVVVFDHCSTGHIETAHALVKHAKAEFIFGDLRKKDEIDSVFDKHKIDAVMHLASFSCVGESMENPDKYYMNNVVGSINLLDSMLQHEVKQLIFSSSCSVYGEPQFVPITEPHQRNPINPYGKGLHLIEEAIHDCCATSDLKAVCLRHFNVVGADSECKVGEWHEPETHLIPRILQIVATPEQQECEIFGEDYPTKDHTCVRDYVDVEDLAEAYALALDYLQKGGDSDVFNIGSNKGYSVREVLAICEKIVEKEIKVAVKSRRAGDAVTMVANNAKAKNVLGWEPKRTLEESIRSAFNWERHLRALEERDEIKIILPAVKPFEYPKGKYFVPMQVGRALSKELNKEEGIVEQDAHAWMREHTIGDDTEVNISDKSGTYGSCSAIYWAWKNYELLGNPKSIGFMHHDKFFAFNNEYFKANQKGVIQEGLCFIEENFMDETCADKIGISDDVLVSTMSDYDIVISKPSNLSTARQKTMSVRGEYSQSLKGTKVEDFDLMIDIVKKHYPRYARHIDAYINSPHKFLYQMFIMKKEFFLEYCSFIFGVLSEIEEKIHFEAYQADGARSLEHLAEVMLTMFVSSKMRDGAKIKEVGVVKIKYPYDKDSIEKIRNLKFRTFVDCLKYKILAKTSRNELEAARWKEKSEELSMLISDGLGLKINFYRGKK